MSREKTKQRSASRRKFIKGTAAVAAGATMFPASAAPTQAPARPRHMDPDLILINGRIHTMDAQNSVVSSVAIKDGRIIATASGRGQPMLPGRETRVIDLRGRTVVPGIIDNHNHLVLMGNRPGHHTPLENAHSIADAQATYAARAKEVPAGAWITTIGGFHFNHLYSIAGDPTSGRLPTRAELDTAAPNNPVFASISFSGPGTTNSLGKSILEAQGVTVSETGAIPSGAETNESILYLRRNLLNAQTRRRGVLDAMKYAASVGVTTHIDQGAFQATNTPSDGAAHEDNFTMHFPFLEIYEQGKGIVRLRINFLHMETDDGTPELVQRLKNAFPFLGNDMVKTGGIGEFIASGTGPRFLEAARKIAKAGWRAEVHSLGRRTPNTNPMFPPDFEQEISAFKIINDEYPGIIAEKRWVIGHVPGITRDWIQNFKDIGGSLSLTGWQYLNGVSQATNPIAPYAGPPFRMILDSGIHAGMSSDGMQIAPMNPWLHMYYATTGLNARQVLINGGQKISRQEVLRLYTSANAWFVREDDIGSIEEGNHADLVVLNMDYFSVPSEDLKKIRSVLTVVGGNIVHDTGAVG